MKLIALFALILVGAQSSAQLDTYFMKVDPSSIACNIEAYDSFQVLITVENKKYPLSRLIFPIQKVENNNEYKTINTSDLKLQCKNAIIQAKQDKTNVIVNIKTAEVVPEQGFFLKRETVGLERQK